MVKSSVGLLVLLLAGCSASDPGVTNAAYAQLMVMHGGGGGVPGWAGPVLVACGLPVAAIITAAVLLPRIGSSSREARLLMQARARDRRAAQEGRTLPATPMKQMPPAAEMSRIYTVNGERRMLPMHPEDDYA